MYLYVRGPPIMAHARNCDKQCNDFCVLANTICAVCGTMVLQDTPSVVKISAGLSTGGVLGFHGVGPCSEILGPIPKRRGSFQIGVRKYFGF